MLPLGSGFAPPPTEHPMHRSPTLRETNSEPSGASVTLLTERTLKASLGALRVLLEGARQNGSATPTIPFVERALRSLDRVEHAAHDLVDWTAPRSLQRSQASVGEIVESIASALPGAIVDRCHFVIDDAEVLLHTDARLLVDASVRSVRARLDADLIDSGTGARVEEIMIHAHADDAWATFSFIDAPSGDEIDALGHVEAAATPILCDAILERDVTRIGGRLSIHDTAGHRCCVAVVPLNLPEDAA